MASSKEKLPYSIMNGKMKQAWEDFGHGVLLDMFSKSLQVCVTPWTGPGKQGSGSQWFVFFCTNWARNLEWIYCYNGKDDFS